jgi:hypothetical protein
MRANDLNSFMERLAFVESRPPSSRLVIDAVRRQSGHAWVVTKWTCFSMAWAACNLLPQDEA